MDIVKLSTSDIATYAIDGTFLSALRQELLDICAGSAMPSSVYSIVEIGIDSGPHKASLVNHDLGPIGALADGTMPNPDKLEILIGGVTPSGLSFNFSVMLRATQADFIYATGPRDVVAGGYELMLRRFAERALPATRSIPSLHMPNRKPDTSSNVLLVTSIILLVATIGVVLFAGPSLVPIPFLAASIALQMMHMGRDEPDRKDAFSIHGEPIEPTKSIDLSRPVGSRHERLEHQPLEPLTI
jgi:hypothetical protein